MQTPTAVDREDDAKGSSEPSFGDILNQFEQEHHAPQKGEGVRDGTVVSITPENIFLDIGMKTDGILPVAAARDEAGAIPVKVGDTIQVTITGRDEEAITSFRSSRLRGPKTGRRWRRLSRKSVQLRAKSRRW